MGAISHRGMLLCACHLNDKWRYCGQHCTVYVAFIENSKSRDCQVSEHCIIKVSSFHYSSKLYIHCQRISFLSIKLRFPDLTCFAEKKKKKKIMLVLSLASCGVLFCMVCSSQQDLFLIGCLSCY